MAQTFDLIIQGGLTANAHGLVYQDIGIAGGKIAFVGDLSNGKGKEWVDAHGLIVMPGVIDTQVHFREPGLEHKEDIESGTRAAICGGVTTIFEMPNTSPPTTTAAALADKVNRAKGRAWCDFGFFVGAALDNLDQLGKLEMLPGSPGIKLFMGSSTGSLLVDSDEAVEAVLRNGKRPVAVHSEDEKRLRQRKAEITPKSVADHCVIRDAEAALICTQRLLDFQAKTGRPVHVLHISTLDELPLLREAKDQGRAVTCEVTPQHLTFSADDYATLGSRIQMNPPIREPEHRAAIRTALTQGLFDVFGSDHAPHTLEEKSKPYPDSPSGMPGVQTLLPALLKMVTEGLIGLPTLVQMTSARPAELFGLKNKGSLAVGMDADIVLAKLGGEHICLDEDMQSKCGWTPYHGRNLKSKVVMTFLRGELAAENGLPVGSPLGEPAQYTWK